MPSKNPKVFEVIVIGSGMAGLNFIDKYLEKGKTLHVISPQENIKLPINSNYDLKLLPSQMRGKYSNVYNYFSANQLQPSSECKALGSLNFGGLANYWGLQLDSYINNDQKNFNKGELKELKKNFFEFLKKFNLLGSYRDKDLKESYLNDYKVPKVFETLIEKKNENFNCKKPILAFSEKNISGNLNKINEKKNKLNANNFYKKISKKSKLIIHNYYLKDLKKKGKNILLICKNKDEEKSFLTKKVVLACGTIATTKILMNFLNIKKEVKIKHHPRLLSVFFSKKPIKYNLNFTPSLLQIINKSRNDFYTADLRPGNKLITESIIDAFPFMKPFRSIINFIRHRLVFSNMLMDSSFSNIYLKKDKNEFKLYSKKTNLKRILRSRNKKVFNFLNKEGVIMPFYKTFFPGSGADYHYFGSVPFQKSGKLAVNNKCQLQSYDNIFVVDGSVFDFRTNKYPLGIVAANARRIAKLLT